MTMTMQMMLCWLVVLLSAPVATATAGAAAAGDERTLLLTQVLFRHGDRSQIASIPLYEDTESTDWPMGLGQLTQRGREMHFHLGRFFQQHYKDAISTYHPSTVRVRSTDYERTLESAQALMSGWFCDEDTTNASPTCLCRTFPIHTVPVEDDNLLLGSSRDHCEHLQYLYRELDPVFADKAAEPVPDALCKNLNKLKKDTPAPPQPKPQPDPSCNVTVSGTCTYGDVLEHLTTLVGAPTPLSPRNVWTISDTNLCRLHHNLTVGAHVYVSDGCDGILQDYLQRLENWDMFIAFTGEERARLSGGLLLKEMRNEMQDTIDGSSKYKALLYSAHDTTVAAFLQALNVSHPKLSPPYAASIRMELYSAGEGKYEVDVLYKMRPEDNADTGIRLVIPGCPKDKPCPFDTFVAATEKLVPSNWHPDCSVPTLASKVLSPGGIAAVITACVIVMIIIVWVYRRRIRHGSSIVYRRAALAAPTSVLQGLGDRRSHLHANLDDSDAGAGDDDDDEEEDVVFPTSLANMRLKARKVQQA
ncbi:hypothetical protein PTSG_05716 [Salpingoeca rosetta]|uniref:Acid phosphatase n=1 Tax=Salpingoeca rosetta (strain ATCC 50818 / BSB-021) TaxID=946362 RepID=F2UB06_SALR5|nr:uncharacterized protein PTSG_05716 [Salpingoeca rosetta]EGD74019.1 hypothetical protein PTSG_05716 [Salpingoeca rosetta]|eukprot:XP_004993581.1 hypothetical protein PTSG_05716 [Salpingoeca rosetta]